MRTCQLLAMALAGLSFAAWATPSLRIMPLGDSITQGAKSENTAGYRGPLWTLLKEAGYNVDYVGSSTATPGTVSGMDTDHEGHGGWRLDATQGGSGIYENLPDWFAKIEAPHVILLHLGTNDSGADTLNDKGRTVRLLDRIFAAQPDAHVILTTLLWRGTAANYTRIQTYNAALPGIVSAQQAKGQKITLLDMHAAVGNDHANFDADLLHPNATGYGVMADAWLGAIQALYPDPENFETANAPAVVKVDREAAADSLALTVRFNQAVDAATAGVAANYVASDPTLGTPTVAVYGRFVQLFYAGDHRSKVFDLAVNGVKAAGNAKTTSQTVPVFSNTLGPENHVPTEEFAKYRLVYDLNVPRQIDHKGWYALPVPYKPDKSKSVAKGSFSRVAYWFETVSATNGAHEWVWVSLDAFTDDPGAIGVPTRRTGKWFQRKVTNLRIWSNNATIVHGDGTPVDEGNIEFWPFSYSTAAGLGLPGANTLPGGGYDFDDTMGGLTSSYGSMQIHDYKAKSVLFGINHWESGGKIYMGIGTNTRGGHPDWTEIQNYLPLYTYSNLKVYVMDDVEAQTQPPEFVGATTRLRGSELVLEFSAPLAADQDFASAITVSGATATDWALDADNPTLLVAKLARPTEATGDVTVTAEGLRDNTPRRTAMAAAQTRTVAGSDLPDEVKRFVPAALRDGYDLVYALEIPVEGFRSTAPYFVARRDYPLAFDRVAYFFEIDGANGTTTNWVWTSFDAWTQDVDKIGVPDTAARSSNGTFVSNLDVASNVNGIQTGTGMTGGYIEFWYEGFSTANAYNVPNASGAVYDFGDQRTTGNWGSMQVHNYEAQQTIWAYNKFAVSYDNWIAVGIGNNTTSTGSPDWTTASANSDWTIKDTRRRLLYVMVRPALTPAVEAPAAIRANVAEAKDYSLLYKVEIPATAMEIQKPANWTAYHTVDNRAAHAGKSIRRVAYYMELVPKNGGETQWGWTSFDAFTQDLDKLTFPTNTTQETKGRVANMNVRVSPGVKATYNIAEGDDIQTGCIEFLHQSMSTPSKIGIPNADIGGNRYDWDDNPTGNAWGCLQVANWGATQMIFSVTASTKTEASGEVAGLGFGNRPTSHPDWTFAKNAGDYSARTLYVFVQEGGAPEKAPTLLNAVAELGGRRVCAEFATKPPDALLDKSLYRISSGTIARVERSDIDPRETILTLEKPLEVGHTYVLEAHTPGLVGGIVGKSFTVPDGQLPAVLNAANVPEVGDYELVYKFTPPTANSLCGMHGAPYTQDETRFRYFGFDRVAYALHLVGTNGVEQWVWASMDAWTDDASKIGIPCVRRANTWQCYVDNLFVASGHTGGTAPDLRTGSFPRGNIEFFTASYSTASAKGIPGADGSVYDFGDSNGSQTEGDTYCSLQVHDYLGGKTVFVVDELGGHLSSGTAKPGTPGVGIGNCPAATSKHKDWTFIHNAAQFPTRDLYVFVRTTAGGLVFTLQPQRARALLHEPLTLTAYAPNAARYQWRKDGVPIDGATAAAYDVPTDAALRATFDVIAYDASGHTATSAAAQVDVSSGGTVLIFR